MARRATPFHGGQAPEGLLQIERKFATNALIVVDQRKETKRNFVRETGETMETDEQC